MDRKQSKVFIVTPAEVLEMLQLTKTQTNNFIQQKKI